MPDSDLRPQAKHLQSRAEYLLRTLRRQLAGDTKVLGDTKAPVSIYVLVAHISDVLHASFVINIFVTLVCPHHTSVGQSTKFAPITDISVTVALISSLFQHKILHHDTCWSWTQVSLLGAVTPGN